MTRRCFVASTLKVLGIMWIVIMTVAGLSDGGLGFNSGSAFYWLLFISPGVALLWTGWLISLPGSKKDSLRDLNGFRENIRLALATETDPELREMYEDALMWSIQLAELRETKGRSETFQHD